MDETTVNPNGWRSSRHQSEVLYPERRGADEVQNVVQKMVILHYDGEPHIIVTVTDPVEHRNHVLQLTPVNVKDLAEACVVALAQAALRGQNV